jgi:DNA-binding NtrC family response regulator
LPPLKKSAAIPLRVLFIGSNGADAILAELERGGYEPAFEAISSAAELVEALSSNWDLAISDYTVGDFGAIAALNLIQEKGVDLPLIAITGKSRDREVLSVLKAGAADHLTRANLMRLNAAVERELRAARL